MSTMRYDDLRPADEEKLMAQVDEFEDDLERGWRKIYSPEGDNLEPV